MTLSRKLFTTALLAATLMELASTPRTQSNMTRAKSNVPTWAPPSRSQQADDEAIAKAEAKRQRKAKKRRREMEKT